MFSSNKSSNYPPLSETVSSSFLDGFVANHELPSYLFSNSNSGPESSLFKTPEVNRQASRHSNQSTPLLTMPPDNSLFKTPEVNRHASQQSNQNTPLLAMPQSVEKSPPANRMTSTPKIVQHEDINLSDIVQMDQEFNARQEKNQQAKDVAVLEDSALQYLSSVLQPGEVRPIGSYSISQLEEEYEKLLVAIKEEREKHAQYIRSLIQSMKDRVERLASDMEGLIEQRFQYLDHCLQEAVENFERELNNGKATEEELRDLRAKINSIVNTLLQTPTKKN